VLVRQKKISIRSKNFRRAVASTICIVSRLLIIAEFILDDEWNSVKESVSSDKLVQI
jgi:hypothetical protein